MNQALQTTVSSLPPVTQTGEKNLNLTNCNGGIINLQLMLQPSDYEILQSFKPIATQPAEITAESLLAIQSFSREYYQLIVTGHEILKENSVVVAKNRALVHGTVPEELFDSLAPLTSPAIAELLKIPAIICNENTLYKGQTDPNQMAIYARITRIKVCGDDIKLYFMPIHVFSQQVLNHYSIDFGINTNCALTELNRSRWSIKKVNLFEAFNDAHIAIPQ